MLSCSRCFLIFQFWFCQRIHACMGRCRHVLAPRRLGDRYDEISPSRPAFLTASLSEDGSGRTEPQDWTPRKSHDSTCSHRHRSPELAVFRGPSGVPLTHSPPPLFRQYTRITHGAMWLGRVRQLGRGCRKLGMFFFSPNAPIKQNMRVSYDWCF